MRGPERPLRTRVLASALALLWLGSACASAGASGPQGYPAEEVAPPEPSGQVYSYPTRGQSLARQDRDRFECHQWSVRQTRFDPSVRRYQPAAAAPAPVAVVPDPPAGTGLLVGAITGALIGAAVSGYHHQSDGAAWGAAAGALLGGISDAARVQQARRIESVYAGQRRAAVTQVDSRASGYRRALSACLEGRGYTVQ